jgi:peptidoglycan/LPS O-acetylase OafA/YrhL
MTPVVHAETSQPATAPSSGPATGDARLQTVDGGSGRAAYDRYLQTGRFGSLDGLRCLCILAVLWHHGPWWTALSDPPQILGRGFVGVDFFFILSGFLITTLLLREERATGRFSLSQFYYRRALRILPVYFFVVTVVATYYIGVKGQTEYLSILPYYYVFLSNFLIDHIPLLAPTWSLAVEEQYYLIWPLLLMCLPRRALLPVLVVLVGLNVVGAMGVFGLTAPDLGPLRIALPNSTYAPILIGSALALALHRPGVFAQLWPLAGHRAAAPLAFGLILLLLQTLPGDLRGLPNLILHLAMAFALAALVMREDHPMAGALGWRPVVRIGEISYGIYLYHLIGLHIVTVGLGAAGVTSAPLILVGYAILSFLIADLSDRTLERFFRKFRHRGVAVSAQAGTRQTSG